MDYKEKYDKLVNAIKVLQETNPSDEGIQNWVNDNVPELRESEDERIIKAIDEAIKDAHVNTLEEYGSSCKEVRDWLKVQLKKQKEQKHVKWSNGDEKIRDDLEYAALLHYPKMSRVSEPHGVIPADNKSHYLGDANEDNRKAFIVGAQWQKEQKPAEWNEEDELHIRELESLVKQVWAIAEHENDKDNIHKMSELSFFLKTLKPQPKQEWSEEDEGFLNLLFAIFTNEHPNGVFSTDNIPVFNGNCVTSNRIISWLKSLKQRYTWKPTEEQMKALHDMNLTGNISYAGQGQILIGLYNDLKKL